MCACKAISLLAKAGMEEFNQGNSSDAVSKLNLAIEQAQLAGSPVIEAKLRGNLALVFEASGDRVQARWELRLALAKVEARVGCRNRLYANFTARLENLQAKAA